MLKIIYSYYMNFAMIVFFIAWMVKVVAEFTSFKTLEKLSITVIWLSAPVFVLKIFEMLAEMRSTY